MPLQIGIAIAIIVGLFLIFKINPFAPLSQLRDWRPKIPHKKQTASEFMKGLEGKKKENLFKRNLHETRYSLQVIGQAQRYKRTVKLSILVGLICGAAALFFFSSPLLMVVLGVGCGFLPLWMVNLAVYAHSKVLNDTLETALSMITTSYTRHNDILLAIKDTLPHTAEPIKAVFTKFVNTVTYIDSNIETAIVKMKKELDNTLFHQWCDVLILCQSDHTLKAGLHPIVSKISRLKAQQERNETKMMLPLKETITMVSLSLCPVPLLMLISPDWYKYLIHTMAGQATMSVVAVIALWSINKAIKLSKPIDYRI